MIYFVDFFILLIGLCFGSFANCLIWRLHENETITGRSYCPKCRKQISWYDNIPLFSFLFLRGKCRHCKKSISWQYPLVELTVALLFMISWRIEMNFISDPKFMFLLIRDWLAIIVMTIIFIYDLRWYLILDIITLPASLLFFILNIYLGISWHNLLISGIIGSSFFLFQFIISRGKWIGGGDIRLGLLMGFILGWPKVLVAIFLAYFIGSIIALGLIIFKIKKLKSEVPLGVFLSVATVVVIFWGEKILAWYLNIL